VTEILLTAREVASQLRIDSDTVYLLAQRGDLECQRFGRAVRFRQEHVDNYLRQTYQPARHEPQTVEEHFAALVGQWEAVCRNEGRR